MFLVYGEDCSGLTFHILLPFGRIYSLLECVGDECFFIGGDFKFWHRFNSDCCGAGVPRVMCYDLIFGVCQCEF